MCDLRVDLTLSDNERDRLRAALLSLSANPYSDYPGFMAEVPELATTPDVPGRLVELCDSLTDADYAAEPYAVLRNCPIDHDVPVFDFDEPVAHKRQVKATFVVLRV